MSPALSAEADQVAIEIETAMAAVRNGHVTDLEGLRQRSDNMCRSAIDEARESTDPVRIQIIERLKKIAERMDTLEELLRTRDAEGYPS